MDGETAFAAESPEFEAVSVTRNDCPTLTLRAFDGSLNEADNAAGICTVTVAGVCVDAESACPLLASVPETVLENVTLPAVFPCTDQVNAWVPPPAIVALAGVGPDTIVAPAPAIDSVGVTDCADASPESFTVTVTVIVWPVFAVAGDAAIAAERAAGT